MNTPMTATHVFYSPSGNCIIDTCTDESQPRSHVNGLTLEEIRTRADFPYPDAVYMEWETASKLMDDKNKTPVSEISESEFWYALEVLPPENWVQGEGCESFKMCEYFSGMITSIYARIGNRYFTFQDHARTKHESIIARCQEFIKGQS